MAKLDKPSVKQRFQQFHKLCIVFLVFVSYSFCLLAGTGTSEPVYWTEARMTLCKELSPIDSAVMQFVLTKVKGKEVVIDSFPRLLMMGEGSKNFAHDSTFVQYLSLPQLATMIDGSMPWSTNLTLYDIRPDGLARRKSLKFDYLPFCECKHEENLVKLKCGDIVTYIVDLDESRVIDSLFSGTGWPSKPLIQPSPSH